MSQLKDPAIKLFGKTIQLLHHPAKPDQEQQHDCADEIKETLDKECSKTQTDDTSSEELINPSTSSGISDDPKTPNTDKETSSKSTPKKENPDANSNSDEKPPKPDKIQPCPRCNSMDTKFCYYNNYNVNQPRHFCKTCQRYWTVGGTLRNTPVGSGRRKNKSSSSGSISDYHHLIVSESLQKTNGNVLNFGSDVPLCESMNSALNFSDKSQKSEDDHSAFCSSSASNLAEKGPNNKNFRGYPLQIPCFPAPPWTYPSNSAQYRPPLVPLTNLGPSGFPVSFYPTPQYWGCTVQPTYTPWVTTSPDQIAPTSPLGKHSREGNLLSPPSNSGNEEFSRDKDCENGVLIPKTLRINDPNEAAKSSLMSTLRMIKDEKGSHSANGGNLYKAFKSKGDEKNEVANSSLVNLQSNPAALSRSLNFRETL